MEGGAIGQHRLLRREFLNRTALLAGALAVSSPLELFASSPDHIIPKRHRAVLHFIKRYSRRFWIAGDRKKSRVLHVKARVRSLRRLCAALAELPFDHVMASGNTLSFRHRGRQVVIENLMTRAAGGLSLP